MFGLILSTPDAAIDLRREAAALMDRLEIPLAGTCCEPSLLFHDDMALEPFLFAAVQALLTPGTAIPAGLMVRHLSGDANPGNVIRRYVFLQLSLLPYLRVHDTITQLPGAHLLGDALLIPHYNEDGGLSCPLPEGEWLDLYTGVAYRGRIHKLQSINQPPVLVRAGTLLPVGFHDRITDGDDADRLTLHWYQPGDAASCTLLTGETYHALWHGSRDAVCSSSSDKPWHLVVHSGGDEWLIR